MSPEKQRRALVAFTFILVLAIVQQRFGYAAGVRALGIGLVVQGLVLLFRQSIDLGTWELTGWMKAFTLLPLFIVGALAALYPNEFACAVNLRGRTCP
jgi:hypothetical protein